MGVLDRWDRHNQQRAEELNEAEPVPDRPQRAIEKVWFGLQMGQALFLAAVLLVVAVVVGVRALVG